MAYGRRYSRRRTSYGRKRKFGRSGRSSTRTMARKAYRTAKKVMRIEKGTKQVFTVSDAHIAADPNLVYTTGLNQIEEGGGEGERIGTNIMGNGLHIKGLVSLFSEPEALPFNRRVRIVVTRSQLINGTHAFTPDDIFTPPALGSGTWDMAIYNRTKVGSTIKILADRTITISDQKLQQPFDIKLPFPYKVELVSVLGKDACYQNMINIHTFPCNPVPTTTGQALVQFNSNFTYFTA